MYIYAKLKGRQYKLQAGQEFIVDRIDAEIGDEYSTDGLLMLVDDAGQVTLKPKGTLVCEVLEHCRAPKVRVVKFRQKKGYRRKIGARHEHTRLRVKAINLSDKVATSA